MHLTFSRLIKSANPLAFALRLSPINARLLTLSVALLLSLLLIVIFRPALETLEERLGALGWTLSPIDSAEQRITLVTIDERSLAEVGPWPWSRQQLAELVVAIDAAGAQLQLHDIVYAEAQPGDDALLAALQAARGTVLAQIPLLQSGQSARTGQMTHPLSGVNCDAAAAGLQISNTSNFLAAHNGFAGIPKGHITAIIASDGAIRKAPAMVCVDDAVYPALAITALLRASNSTSWSARTEPGSGWFGPEQVLKLDAYPGLDIPLDDEGNLRISYANLPSNYLALSAVDILNGTADTELLDNAWVLVGGTAFGMGDIVPTPYNGATHGVEIQARILGSLLDVAMPYSPRAGSSILGLLSLVFAAIALWLAAAPGRVSAYGLPIAAVLMPVTALTLHIELLNVFEIWLGWLFPAVFGMAAASLLLLLEQSRIRGERIRVYSNLHSYLPADIAKEIAYSLPSSSINARRCDVTLLSADLRNFSAFGESRPPEESAAVLHFFFVRATEIVERHGGRIHEFKGDSLLAVWDGQDARAAEMALASAQQMQAEIQHEFLPGQAPAGLEPLALGIGIEQGPALIGSIGPAHRRSHTLLGDTVVISLRIQELTAELAQPILIGECAARQLSNAKLESQGSYLLAGLRIPHTLFAPDPGVNAVGQNKSGQPNLKVVAGGRGRA